MGQLHLDVSIFLFQVTRQAHKKLQIVEKLDFNAI